MTHLDRDVDTHVIIRCPFLGFLLPQQRLVVTCTWISRATSDPVTRNGLVEAV
jgi:hypothetical protein